MEDTLNVEYIFEFFFMEDTVNVEYIFEIFFVKLIYRYYSSN
jgi:hypothetical protein